MAAAAGPFRFTLVDVADLSDARHSLAEWLEEVPGSDAVSADLVSAAAELCLNALDAEASKTELCARVESRSVVIDVTDDGPGMAGELPELPPAPLADSGRGLYLVRQLMDVLWISNRPGGGTRATCARRLTP